MMSSRISKQETQALFAAIRAGDIKHVKVFLRAGGYPNIRDPKFFNETALIAAARHRQEAVFLELVRAGADLHGTAGLGKTVLNNAASNGTLAMVQAVIADGIKPTDELADAFQFACCSNSPAVVKELLKAGADVNGKGWDGGAPLITAVEYKRADIVAVLLKAGAKTDVRVPRDELGDNKHYKKTALELARAEGLRAIVRMLEDAGAKLPPVPKRSKAPTSISDFWKRIAAWLKGNAPAWKTLRNGATATQIMAAERKLGFSLPAELRTSFQCHNGSNHGQLFPCADDISFYLLSLAEMTAEWKLLKDLLDSGNFSGNKAISAKGIRNDWWNPAWLPFAGNGGGDCFCLDMDPAKGGSIGQIIHWRHDQPERTLLAPSLRACLADLVEGLESGKYSYSEDEGII